MKFWLVLLFGFAPVASAQTNAPVPAPVTPTQTSTTSDIPKADGTLTTKITYNSQVGDTCVVSYNSGQNKIVMYGLPASFAEGDSLEGTFYPAGTKVAGDKKYHAFAVTKESAESAMGDHAKRIKELKQEIAKDQQKHEMFEKIAVAEIQAYGADSTDAARTRQDIEDTDAEIARDKEELATLKRD
jgi:hypothetical protein